MTTVAPLFSQLDATSRAGSASSSNIADDFSTFLKLLTIQLQNQDPLEPLDTNQFTEQIVNMTQVEQTVSMNARLGSLIDAQETQRIQSAIDFVGKEADALGDIVPLTEDGAEMFYNLTIPASKVSVDVVEVDANNQIVRFVRSLEAPSKDVGLHRVSWDGDNNAGDPVDPNRTYRLRVSPFDSKDQQTEAPKIGFSGVIDEIRNEDGALVLSMSGRNVALDQIVATRKPASQSDAAS